MDGNAQNMYHGGQGDAYYRYDPTAPRGMGPPPGYSAHPPRHRAPIPLQQQQQPQYPTYQPDNMYSMGADQHASMSLGDITGWGSQPVPPQPYGQPMGYGHPSPQPPQRQTVTQASYRQHMTGYPQDPKQMQAAYSSQQNMMSGMIPQQGYGSIPQSQHQQQAQQRISQHYPQSGHQMYPTPPQQAPAPQPYGGYGVQHQSSRSTSAQHPGYSHTGLDQSSYGHLPNQGPVGLPPIGIQQTQQSHLTQTPQSHQQQQQQLHQLQHPSMNPAAQPPVLGSSHGAQQQAQSQQQSHLTPQSQHAASAMHHSSSASQHQSTMAAQQANQASHQIPQVHNPAQMPHQMGHGMLPSYGSQMAAAPAAAPPQVPTYLPNSKQTPATQQHGSSPQYRAPFPQLSPQMSPRPQMSPHPQMSPRPVMSPAKPPTQQAQNVQQASSNISSPHPHMPGISSPSARSQPTLPPIQTNVKSSIAPSSAGGVNTLAALEQMVMPGSNPGGMDYNQTGYRQQALPSMPNNPLSPLGSRVTMSPQHQQHQQWPTHRSQMNGSHHGMMPQAQMQMQQQQQMQQNQSAGQMMAQLPDLMSASQPMQVIPPSNQHQQSSYNSYEELTQVTQPQQKSTLDSIHKPYENLTPSIPSQQMGNSLISQQLMSPTLQNQQQQQQQQQMDTQDQYVSLQTNQSSLSTLESTDQSSDLNLLDSYSNSATVNTSNMSSTAQKSSIDDSLLSQNTNDNSQSSQISDNANNILQVNSFTNDINHDDNANQQSMDQDLPCLDPTDGSDEYQKPSEMENDHVSQDSQEQEVTDKIDELQFGFGNDQGLKPKSADSTMINETEKSLSNEMTNVVPDIVNNVEHIPSQSKMETGMMPINQQLPVYPPGPHQVPNFNMGYNIQQPPYTAMPHHQERTMLQQQLQELYILPPAPENQEKIHRTQERITILQQHETTDQCLGGIPSCVLQNPMFSMIDSPQVTSTTGRGRGRGNSSKPRKPRAKKSEKQSQAQATEDESPPIDPSNLPVSEDSVTAGTGLSDLSQIYSEDNEMADLSQDNLIGDLDTSTDASGKKIKKPRKPRAPKPPKEPKSEKEPKERKKKESEKTKKKKGKKDSLSDAGENSVSHDNNSTELSKQTSEGEENQTLASLMHNQNSTDANSGEDKAPDGDEAKTDESKADEVTDFDDIPVSKIAIKSLLEEKDKANLSDDGNAGSEDHFSGEDESPSKKKGKSKSRRSVGSANKNRSRAVNRGGGKSSRRSGRAKIVQDSGDEGGDDLITTPPASPTGEDLDLDSSKRRSARNTQRKKYTDDVMLRFSDDDTALISPVKRETNAKGEEIKKEKVEGEEGSNMSTSELNDGTMDNIDVKLPPPEDISNKPNYVYINTTDEDTMIVQFVLSQRMGKRELKPDPPPVIKKEEPEVKEENGAVKTEGADVETTESKEKVEDDKEKTEAVADEKKDAEKMEVDEEASEKPTEEKTPEEPEKEVEEPEKMETETALEKPVEEVVEKETVEEAVEKETVEGDKVEEEKSEEKSETEEKKPEVKEEPAVEKTEAEKAADAEKAANPDKPEPVFIEVEEYFVKYRNFSYLHCEWRTEDELLKGDKRVSNKIRRFQQKQSQQFNIFENIEEDPFNPDFVEVDRILDCSEHTDDDGNTVKHYLVKWKSLPYEDSTWELEEDIEEIKIEQFERFNKIPPKNEWKLKRRPHADQWKQLEKTPVYKGNNTLRAYQLEGLNWLTYSYHKGNNCILADEMGLGKTIQSLTFVHSVYKYGIRGPFLVIAPLSTIPNWQREFESWTDMNVVVYHGSSTSRQMLSDYEVYYKHENGKQIKDIIKFNVLITTFEMIVTDYMDLKNYNFRVCVIDEAHRLKNRNCKLLEGLRQLNLEHRVLLSGTPLQNNVNELFSLLNFLEPSQFASNEDFLREFGSLRTEGEVQKLQALLKPMMLRRLKDDVEKSLAPKEETIVEVELTNIQKKYYRGILEQNFSFLQKGTSAANIPNLMNTMMELRKCCIHPYLLNGAEDQIQYEWRLQHGDDRDSYHKNIVNASGKMVLIDKLLPKLKANGHRVLIFSQMVRCLDILEDYLIFKKYPFERIDGRIRGNLRQAAIDRYSKPDSDRFVFLLCTKAGGLGINLTAADTVIIYDSDWNPQNDLQAQARCHRIGQQKMVKIYRLLCRNTYEREMFDKASLKLGLDKAILQSMNTSLAAGGKETNGKQLTKKEIEDLLKKGAYGAVMDDDAGDKFCEEDIDSILQRRTQIITMESEKGSTFSKASFASSGSGNRSDINIDDPDFWGKWAKKAEIDTTIGEKDEIEDLVLSEPRRRTQIKRYGHDDGVMDMSEESTGLETDEEGGIGASLRSKRRKEKMRRGKIMDEYIPRDRDTLAALGFEDVSYGSWARSECFKVEKGLLSFGWGRWSEIHEQGAFKRGWKESDVEDCSRVILLFCLQRYQGDEKIKTFIWDLIKPCGLGEESTIARNHSGLHNLVPRGRNAKGRKGKAGSSGMIKEPSSAGPSSPRASSSASSTVSVLDDNHWSKDDKYDADSYLDINYKKHLTRHANKVLLRVRMLYYIKHEIIGDYVQQIQDGMPISDLPIRPPPTTDQMPCSWWNPKCCDKSLLVGTYKHGCESYRQMRADPSLCYISHCGPGEVTDDISICKENDDETNSKHGDDDEEVRSTKDGEDRPSSSGLDDEESSTAHPSEMDPNLIWPSMQDLNTRLRRVITSYQRNYKKEELKQQQKAKLQSIVPPGQSGANGGSASNPTASTSYSSALAASMAQQQQSQSKHGQQSQVQIPTAADISLLLSLGMGGLDASQLANLDLQKLAMYLKMERREKIEQVVRERERSRFDQIPKKWTRRDENEFLRVLTGYGIDLQPHTSVPMPDWSRFKTFAKLDKKSDENLSDYYKVFIAMCKRQAGEKLLEEERGLDGLIDDIGEDHAKLILDRLELLSKLREIAKHPKLEERLKLCENNLDTPDWWEPGKHDRELVRAVLKYGLYRSDQYILNDNEFPFADAEKHYVRSLEVLKSFKFDNPADLFKLAMGEMPGKSPKTETKSEPVTPVKVDEKEKEPSVEKEVEKAEETAVVEKTAEVPEVEKEESVKSPSQEKEKSPEKEVEKETAVTEEEVKTPDSEAVPAEKLDEAVPEEEKMETDEVAQDLAPKTPVEQPMEVDAEEKPTEAETAKVSKETTEDEEEVKDVAEKAEEKPEEEKMEVSEEKPIEPEVPVVDESEKEEIVQSDEEKAEPKIDEPVKSDEAVVEPKSPEKPGEELEATKEVEPVVEIKQEPGVERPEGEPKIIDTVVIDDDDTLPEKATESGSTSNQADELRARFPDLEVFQPLMKLKQLDAMMLKGDVKDNLKSLSRVFDTSMVVKWFRDFALEKRIRDIICCVEKGVWPVGKSYSAYSGCMGIDLDLPLYETVKRINLNDDKRSSSSTPDIITITTDHHQMGKSSLSALQSQLHQSMSAMTSKGKKGQKRHIAIDVETERAKLHALLNNTTPHSGSHKSNWNEDDQETGRRSGSGLQPPPAHQAPSRGQMSQYKPTVTIPGTSSTLTPIDLSSSLPKMRIADILRKPTADMSEVQDFSMGSKSRGGMGLSQTSPSSSAGKGKLNDMLTKLMKKNNVPMDEPQPPLSKEKKRRKLDEIVLGLSAASSKQPEQKSIFGDPGLSMSSSKKPQITPSVSVTPANAQSQSQSHSSQNQKPFTITVTSVPGSSKGQSQSQSASGSSGMAALQNMSNMTSKESMNAMILQAAQAEQQAFLKQQQKIIQSIPANSPQRKAYEAMFAEMKQALELSSKLGSYGSGGAHDAKVNKWLAEQTAALTEQALSMEYLSRSAAAAMGGSGQSQSQSSSRRSSSSQQQSSNSSSSSNMRGRSSQSSQSQQAQAQAAAAAQAQADAQAMANINWNSLTGEENVSVIHKSTGKRLTGRNAPQLKRLSQWLKENPMYEIDPKWTESLTMPSPSVPQSSSSMNQKSSMANETNYSKSSMSRSSNSGNQYSQSGHGSSTSTSSSSNKKQSSSSSQSQSAAAAAASMANFPGLSGLNANLLSSLPGLGAFDPKNPLSSMMPFAGMPGLGSMANMGNMNNMNLFGNLAALGGLAGMDAQSLAAVMAAASLDPSTAAALAKGVGSSSGSGQSSNNQSSNKSRKSNDSSSPSTSQQQSSSSSSKQSSSSQSAAAQAAANLANSSAFPFFFPNPSLLYTPLGLSGLNPYSLPGGMSAYDQLAQQCNLLNGTGMSSASTGTTSTSSSSRQSSSNKNSSSTSSSSRGGGGNMGSSHQSSSSPSNKSSRNSASNMNSMAAAAARDAQLQSLLLPHDTHLLESLSRATGLDITQSSSSRSSGSSSQEKRSNAAQQANKEALEKLERDRRKLLEQLTRNGFPTDFATMQALAKMPTGLGGGSSSSSMKGSSAKDIPLPLPADFSQALFAEMMAQTAAAVSGSSSSSSSKRARDQEMKDALEQLSKNPVELLARSLGVGPGISLIPTSSASSIHDSKRMRQDSSSSSSAAAAISLTPTSSKSSDMKSLLMGSSEDMKSPRSSRTESSSSSSRREHQEQQDKVTLTPVSAASIGASLPSQTTISLSTSGSSASTSSSSREREREREPSREHERERSMHHSPQASQQQATNLSSSSSSSSKERDVGENLKKQSSSEVQQQQHEQQQQHDPNMDIEDLIAQSKVSKGGELQSEDQHMDLSQRKSEDSSQEQLDQQQDENTGDESEGRRARRSRAKRPRSGDDMETTATMPERKRELRSSAGRLAAAAAARMAAEAKAAQQAAAQENASLNLSVSSDGKDGATSE